MILDGLDEITEQLRPAALRALSQQAAFRLVILARTGEMAAAAAHGHLAGAAAVELQDVDAATAAGYLTRVQLDPPPPGWRQLTERLVRAPDSPLAAALGSPLTLTLVRDTYRDQDDVRELLGFCGSAGSAVSRDDIVDHLLDRVLPAAYAQQPGHPPPRYDLQAAHNTLSRLAVQMNQEGTRDLRWWHVPRWVPAMPRILVMTALALALLALVDQAVGWVTTTIWSSPRFAYLIVYEIGDGLVFGQTFGLVFGLVLWVAVSRRSGFPQRIRPVRWREVFRGDVRGRVLWGLVLGLVLGLAAGILAGTGDQLAVSLVVGAGIGLVLGLAVVLTFSRPGVDDASSVIPLASWRADLAFGLRAGLVFGLVFGLTIGLTIGLTVGLWNGLAALLAALLAAGPVFTLFTTKTWPASVAFVQLAVRWHSPVRLMRFLEDARQRHVLRIVGPVYQFRHARLQDRLAEQASPAARQPDPLALAAQNEP